jgi:hypothetical protein
VITNDIRSAAHVHGWSLTRTHPFSKRAVLERGDVCIHVNNRQARAYRGNALMAILRTTELAEYLRSSVVPAE